MSLFYGLICMVLTFAWMYAGESKWILIAVTFGVLQIVSEIVSAIAGYWIAKKKILDKIREGQNASAGVNGNALSKKGSNEL